MQPKNLFALARLKHIKPLYWLALLSLVGALVLVPLWMIDPRTLGGVSVWEKPLKFFISSVVFSITYSWLSSFITRGARWVKLSGLFIAVF